MTDNTNQSNPVTPDATSELSNTTTWQLTALTAALGDLQLSVSDSLSVGRGSDNDVVLAVKRCHQPRSTKRAGYRALCKA